MSYKVEHFQGHWFDEGLVFATKDEATAYSRHKGVIPSRVVPATRESTMQVGILADVPVNYTFKDGKLAPYKVPTKASVSWEEYMLGGGHGMPIGICTDTGVVWINELPDIPEIPGYELRWVAKPTNARPRCDGCKQEIDPDCCGCGESREGHASAMMCGHPFIPMGCDCFRAP